MSAVADETTTELTDVYEMIEKDEARRAREAAKAPQGFDPSCVFLLSLGFENLFEPIGIPFKVRCKGCLKTVALWNRQEHHKRHKQNALNMPDAPRGALAKGGTTMGKTGSKEAQMRKQREERAEGVSAVEGAETTELPEETGEGVTEPEKAPEAKPKREPSPPDTAGWEESQAIFRELVSQFEKKTKGAVETKWNDKTGYASVKVDGKLVGYGWWTRKPTLRLEAAITPADVGSPEGVKDYKRSKDIAAATVIEGTKAGYALGLKMLVAAAKKQASK